jgi:hypothetical protein
VRLLCATIVGEALARGERARELSRQARERIHADFNVNDQHTPLRARQKLITVVTLLRAMPEPSTPGSRNLRREAQALIELEPCSKSRAQHPAYTISPLRGTMATHKTRRRPSMHAAPWDGQQTRAGRKSRSGSSTHADKPKMVMPAMS